MFKFNYANVIRKTILKLENKLTKHKNLDKVKNKK